MNERIEQLAEQAGWGKGETQDDCMQCSPFDKEKFAELIVSEWVGLTDDEVHALSPFYIEPSTYDLIRAAEAKLKEKNT
jgi:hypothetical protein